ncbi:MAG: Uma2 family endonuclease, partial [Chloroflexota bacterium]
KFDFIDGEMVEVTPKFEHGVIQAEFAIEFGNWLRQNPLGKVVTEVLHVLGGEKMMPDVCIHVNGTDSYYTTAPLVAVEIRSDSQSRPAQRKKALAYIENGTKMAIAVFPGEGLEVYRPDREPLALTYGDMLDGDDVLPGFRVKVDGLL